MNDQQKDLYARALERGVPEHDIESLVMYLTKGRPLGGFLEAVVDNDLHGAIARADMANRLRLPEIMLFLDRDAPKGAFGFKGAYDNWLDSFQRSTK